MELSGGHGALPSRVIDDGELGGTQSRSDDPHGECELPFIYTAFPLPHSQSL